MPLKIALVGAPGSGKTELAQQINKALNRSFQCVDNYVEELETETNISFSHYANHFANAMVVCKRVAKERNVEDVLNPDGGLEVRVTCGTILETTIYSALFALSNADTGVGQINLINDKRAQIAMTWLGVAALDTWEYDYSFYCPYDGNDNWQGIVDENIPEAIDALGVKITKLPDAREERLAKVLEELQSYKWGNGADADAEAIEE